MPRAMWKGAIQFGLVTIPVKLYLATESKGISFNMLHATDLSRIQMKTYCPVEDEVISRGDTVRGFEWAPGEYVVVSDEDLERVPLKTVRSIEIELFTKASRDQGTIRFAKSAYYLEPDKIGQKAFALLRTVLAEHGLTAICKVVIKDREALAALDPFEGTMLLTTLHWPDEIRATADLDLPASDLAFKPAELAMAEQLVSAMTAEFEPSAYRDEYREALMEVIQEKVAGREVAAIAAPTPTGNLVDLMAALEASVNAAKASRTDTPVSVTDVRAAKVKAAGAKAGGAGVKGSTAMPVGASSGNGRSKKAATAQVAEVEADAEPEARPVRRRKSA